MRESKTQEKDKTERATGLGRKKNKTGDIEKRDQTDNSEIPDKGETSKIHGLPSGRLERENV